MEKMNIKEIDFSKLEKAKIQGTQSTVYFDGDKCIKVLKGCTKEELNKLYEKFMEIDGVKIDGVIFPKTLLMDGNVLKAYIMDRFDDSETLNDHFTKNRFENVNEILQAVKNASLILRKLHDNDIICQDLSFENILINSDGDIRYIDLDGCSHENFYSPYVSGILNRYKMHYCKEKDIFVNRKSDKLSLMLAFFQLIYFKEIQKVSEKEYKTLSSNVQTLKNLYAYRNYIITKKTDKIYIPYLDEFINLDGDYIIDRNHQLPIKTRIIRKLFY